MAPTVQTERPYRTRNLSYCIKIKKTDTPGTFRKQKCYQTAADKIPKNKDLN